MDCSPPDLPGKDTGVDCYFLLQGIFPTQGLNSCFLHCRQILYQLSYKGSPLTRLTVVIISLYTYGCVCWGVGISSVQLLSHVRCFATPWSAAIQDSPSVTNCWSVLTLMSIELVMPSNHFILCSPLLLLPAVFPSTRVLSNEPVLPVR